MWPAFALAAGGFAASALLLMGDQGLQRGRIIGRSKRATTLAKGRSLCTDACSASARSVCSLSSRSPWPLASTGSSTPACRRSHCDKLGVDPSAIGTAMALNSVVIVGLQVWIVRVTKKRSGEALLIAVASIWAATWLLLEVACSRPLSSRAMIFVAAFVFFALGETLFAPILSPMTAAVAPEGTVGTTLGLLAAARTVTYAAGPLVAGLLLALDLPHVFVLLHVAINLLGAVFAWRLLAGSHSRGGTRSEDRREDRASGRRSSDPRRLSNQAGRASVIGWIMGRWTDDSMM